MDPVSTVRIPRRAGQRDRRPLRGVHGWPYGIRSRQVRKLDPMRVAAPSRWSGRLWIAAGVAAGLAVASGCGGPGDGDEPLHPVVRAEPGPPPDRPVAASEQMPQAPVLPPRPRHPVHDDAIAAAHQVAQRRLLRADDPLQPPLPPLPEGPLPGPDQVTTPDGGETYEGPLPGFFSPMQIAPDDDPLARFNRALGSLEDGERDEPVHLAFYGASGTAADLWTGYVRAYLQARFGDAGPGLVAAAKPNRWYRHNDFTVSNSRRGWTKRNTYHLPEQAPPAPFGAMGQAMSSDLDGAWSEVEPKSDSPSADGIEWYEVHYLVQPGGGSFTAKLDGRRVATTSTATANTDAARRWGSLRLEFTKLGHGPDAPPPTLRLEIEGDGEVWLLGVEAEADRPGIVLDTLGVNGGKLANQLAWDEAIWASHLRDRSPVLYVLAFGNNESVDEDEPISLYEQNHRTILDRFAKTLPEASCVLVGPGDFPKKDEETGELAPRPRLTQLREVQRALAAEYGCGFIDALEIIGGEYGKIAWYHAGLGRDDYLHLTRDGYLRFGMAIADALLQPYDWQRAHRPPP